MTIIRHTKLLSLALPLVALALITPAQAENIDGFYISGAVGMTSHMNIKTTGTGSGSVSGSTVTLKGAGDVKHDKAARYSFAIGSHFGNRIRAEVELSRGSVDGKPTGSVTVSSTPNTPLSSTYKSITTSTAVMLNSYYDFMAGSPFRPYVSVGIGYTMSEREVFDPKDNNKNVESSNGKYLTYQVGAGVSYALSDNMNLFGGYRFRNVLVKDKDPINVHIEPVSGTNLPFSINLDDNYASHEVHAGLRYEF